MKIDEYDILWEHSYGKKLPKRSFVFFNTLEEAEEMLDKIQTVVGIPFTYARYINDIAKTCITGIREPLASVVGYFPIDLREHTQIAVWHSNSRFSDVKPIYIIIFPKARFIFTPKKEIQK